MSRTRTRRTLQLGVAVATLAGAVVVLEGMAVGTPGIADVDLPLVRVLDREDTGRTDAVVHSPLSGRVYGVGADGLTVFDVGARAQQLPAARWPATAAPMAFDRTRGRLLVVADGTVTSYAEHPAGGFDLLTARTEQVPALRGAVSIAVDGAGRAWAADGSGSLTVVEPVDGSLAAGAVRTVQVAGDAALTLVTVDHGSGLLYAYDADGGRVLEFTGDGNVVRSLAGAGIGDERPTSLAVAPSFDRTDDPSTSDLLLTLSGSGRVAVGSLSPLVPTPLVASATSTLVRKVSTATWATPSPDPSGIQYLASSNRLIITDGEVEEVVAGITHFQGANVWETTLTGDQVRTGNISSVAPVAVSISDEPTGIAYNPAANRYYISDDGTLRIYVVNPGADGALGTSDDSVTNFRTSTAGGIDSEGVAYDSIRDTIWVADGMNQEIYQYRPDGTFVSQFDVAKDGVIDPESVEFDPISGLLYVLSNAGNPIVAVYDINGTMVDSYNVAAGGAIAPAGLTIGPSTTGTGRSFYIVDRAVDNDSDPNAIDGSLIEMTGPASGGTTNQPPTVNAGADVSFTSGTNTTLTGTVSDDGLPNGTLIRTWSQVSGPGILSFGSPSSNVTTVSASTVGTYVVRLSVSDGAVSVSDEVTVTVTPGSGGINVVDVRITNGNDDAEEATGTNIVTLTSSDMDMMNDGATAVNSVAGYRFSGLNIPQGATITSAYLQFAADEVQSGLTDLTIRANAADNAAAFQSLRTNLSARPTTTASVAWNVPAWTAVSQAGGAQRTPDLAAVVQEVVNRAGFGTASSIAFLVTGAGQRVARSFETAPAAAALLHVEWTLGGTGPVNQAPVVSAGADVGFTLPASGSLSGSVSDDGLPSNTLTRSWSQVSGPGTLSFGSPSAAVTSVSASVAGVYTARLTASDGALSSSDDVVITVNPAAPVNQAPVVSAGADVGFTLPASGSLSGSVSDDGLPSNTLTRSWSQVSGPGTLSFGSPSAAVTSVSASVAGVYTARLTASDGALSSSDDVVITVNPAAPVNQAPVVSAGADVGFTLPASGSLSGSVSDDGLPSNTLTRSWSQVSGPGTLSFGSPSAAVTSVSASVAGVYTARLTASDGALSSSDDVVITVNPAPPADGIFADGFESGSFSAWSASTTDAGNLSVTAASTLNGTRGMAALINDNNSIFVTDNSPVAERRYRARFRFDPNTITMANNDAHVIFMAYDAAGAVVAGVEFRRTTAAGYGVRGVTYTDGNASRTTSWYTIADSPRVIELDWVASTAAGANNGTFTFWTDGVQRQVLTGIDSDTRRVESARLGAVTGVDRGTRGTTFFDDFVSRRTTYIGV